MEGQPSKGAWTAPRLGPILSGVFWPPPKGTKCPSPMMDTSLTTTRPQSEDHWVMSMICSGSAKVSSFKNSGKCDLKYVIVSWLLRTLPKSTVTRVFGFFLPLHIAFPPSYGLTGSFASQQRRCLKHAPGGHQTIRNVARDMKSFTHQQLLLC